MEINNATYCVYIHTNKINGKMYVGQTVHGNNPEKRWNNGKGYSSSTYFYSAIEKYGWDNFDHQIIASNLTKSEADNFEKLLIKELNTMNKKVGYNLTAGGDGNVGYSPSDETRQKISNSLKGQPRSREAIEKTRRALLGTHLSEETKKKLSESKKGKQNPMYGVGLCGEKNGMYGKHHSEETREKLRQIFSGEGSPNYGKSMSEEQKKKLSEARKGKYAGENNAFYGRTHSEEARKKIGDAHRGGKAPNAKPVVQLDDYGNLIQQWESIATAWQTLGICRMSIPNCLSGKQKSAGGYKWMYLSDYEQLNEI